MLENIQVIIGPNGAGKSKYLRKVAPKAMIYDYWVTGARSPLRNSCSTGLSGVHLDKDLGNLPICLRYLWALERNWVPLQKRFDEIDPEFQELMFVGDRLNSDGYRDISVLWQREKEVVPFHELSDGLLRYIMLMTILHDPEPPKEGVVIENPELNLHPDMFPRIKEAILDFADKTKIWVTTHSPAFLDGWSSYPSVVRVLHLDGTSEQLDAESMEIWLKRESLGSLWTKGQIGGNRW